MAIIRVRAVIEKHVLFLIRQLFNSQQIGNPATSKVHAKSEFILIQTSVPVDITVKETGGNRTPESVLVS